MRASHRPPAAVRTRAAGYMLVYLLALIPLLAVITTLLLEGTGSILRAQRVAVAQVDEYAVLSDWLHALREDTRGASGLKWSRGTGVSAGRVLALSGPDGDVTYEFGDGRLTRTAHPLDHPTAVQSWVVPSMTVDLTVSHGDAGELIELTVEWKRRVRRRLEQPVRRFETCFLVGRGYER